MLTLPDMIDLLATPWTRAQTLGRICHPAAGIPAYGSTRLTVRQTEAIDFRVLPPHSEPTWRALWGSMLVSGYRPTEAAKVESHHHLQGVPTPSPTIAVELDANGDIKVMDGVHRILCLLLIGATEIRATVHRDPAWVAFVERAAALHGFSAPFLYHRIPHPDFAGFGWQRDETRAERLWRFWQDHDVQTLLDIGPCSGTFSVRAAHLLQSVTAVERSNGYLDIARWLAGYQVRANVTWVQGDACDGLPATPARWDMAACLSMLHHVIGERGPDGARALLLALAARCRFLAFEFPKADEPILAANPAGRAVAADLTEWMRGSGWEFVQDLGPDTSWQGSHPRILTTWRSTCSAS